MSAVSPSRSTSRAPTSTAATRARSASATRRRSAPRWPVPSGRSCRSRATAASCTTCRNCRPPRCTASTSWPSCSPTARTATSAACRSDYGNRLIASDLLNPDFVRLADSFGMAARGQRAGRPRRGPADALARDEPALLTAKVGEMPDPWPYIHLPRVRADDTRAQAERCCGRFTRRALPTSPN